MMRSALRHCFLLIMALGLVGLGSGLIARGDSQFAGSVGAQSLGYVQISEPGSGNWTDVLGPVWVLENGAPGDFVHGAIAIRTVDIPNPGTTSLHISAQIDASLAGNPLADYLLIDGLYLGAVNLLNYWDESCRPNGKMSLAMLAACEAPRLPVPPGGNGAILGLTLMVDPDAGNSIQGLSTGLVSFLFTLEDTSPDATDPGDDVTGTIRAVVETPSVLPPSVLTLSVDGSTGVSGPGPMQQATAIVGQQRTVALVAPETWADSTFIYGITLESTVCVSDTAGNLGVAAAAWAVNVTLTAEDETITCTFTTGVEIVGNVTPEIPTPTATTPGTPATPTTPTTPGATETPATITPSATPVPSATPGAPSSGTGTSAADSVGMSLIVIGVAIAVLWTISTGLSLATLRRRSR